jgi:hypothetical protein
VFGCESGARITLAVRKFLKEIGLTSQREIQRIVRDAEDR